MRKNPPLRKAFTLIELLVVIAIIAILAAILFPVFAQAKAAAKKTQALAHMKQIGTAEQIYLTDNDDTYQPAYYYNNPLASGSLDATGINHWSGVLSPYVKNWDMFRSPEDPSLGIAPTNWDDRPGGGNNLGYGGGGSVSFTPGTGLQDNQAPRISFTANEAVMPRPRGGIGGVLIGQTQNVVSATSLNSVAGTILITDFSNYPRAVSGTGPGGTTNKSHRPTDAWALDAAGTIPYDVSGTANSPIWALTPAAAKVIFDAQPTAPFGGGTYPHIIYGNPGRYTGKVDVFVYTDTHAKAKNVYQTLSCDGFEWGDKAYNQAGADVLCSATGIPVTAK